MAKPYIFASRPHVKAIIILSEAQKIYKSNLDVFGIYQVCLPTEGSMSDTDTFYLYILAIVYFNQIAYYRASPIIYVSSPKYFNIVRIFYNHFPIEHSSFFQIISGIRL